MTDFDNYSIKNIINDLQMRIAKLEGRTINGVSQLDSITNDLGVQQAGEFRTGEGTPGEGFSGVRMAYPAMDYDVGGVTQQFNIAGVNNDVLQFGLDATSGAAIAGGGAVKIDEDGIRIETKSVTDWVEQNSINFTKSGTIVGGLTAYDSINIDMITLESYNTFPNIDIRVRNNNDEMAGLMITDGNVANLYSGITGQAIVKFRFQVDGDLYLAYTSSIRESIPLGCRVYRNSTQAITGSQWNALSWNTEISDTDACWSAGIPTKMYAKTTGYYMAGGGCNSSGINIFASVRVNGSTYVTTNNAGTAVSVCSGMIYLDADAGDYVEICAYPASNCTIAAGTSTNIYFNHGWLVRIA